MNLVITMKLTDRSLTNHILPVTHLEYIDSITIVRDTPGQDITKVRYLTPSRFMGTSAVLKVPARFFQMIRASLSGKPALVHSFLLFPHGYLAFFAGKLTGRKVGVSLIAGPVETFIFGNNPIGTYSYCQPLSQSNSMNRVILFLLKRFDVITVTGSYTRNYLISKGIDEGKIWILPHVVDEHFRPLSTIKKEYDLIFIGRLVRVKHVETIIRAVSVVKDTLPSIKLAIVGDGEERTMLEELTRSLGLSDNIDFAGYQANTWEWYNRGKISLLTSEREGFPYTVIESLRCGVPVIVSKCGDVTDIVKDTYNGRIIPDYQDYHAYAEAIIGLIQNPALLDSYSKNCLKSFENEVPNPVETIWDQILQSSGRRKNREA